MPRTTRDVLALLVLTLSAASCGGAEGAGDVERSDSAGVEIVVNRAADRELAWTFTPALVLGGEEEGPQSFYQVGAGSVDTDDAGNLYVYDRSNQRLVSFDREGTHRWSAGQEGGGPGEFGWVASLAAASDGTLEAFDIRNRRLTRYSGDGEYLGSTPIEQGTFSATARPVSSGRVALITEFTGINTASTQRLVYVSAAGDSTDMWAVERAQPKMMQFEGCPIRFPINPIFAPDLDWSANRRLVVTAHEVAYSLWIFEDGVPMRAVRRDLPPVPATVELAAMQYPDGFNISAGTTRCEIPAEDVVEQAGFASAIPAVNRLAVAPDGTIWVERGRAADGERRKDIFQPDGTYLGTLPLDAPWPIAFMPDGAPVGARTDDLDITRVVVYTVEVRP